MNQINQLPLTPDFNVYRIIAKPEKVFIENDSLGVNWDNGLKSFYHKIWLIDNSSGEKHMNQMTREQTLELTAIPLDIEIVKATIHAFGVIKIEWSHDLGISEYHPGWLYAHDRTVFQNENQLKNEKTLWDRSFMPYPPSFEGEDILENDDTLFDWLSAVDNYGLALLKNTPNKIGFVEQLASRVGTIRESNFGRIFDVHVSIKPDSNAYTSLELKPHVDLATREYMPGLQYLHCIKNTAKGGEAGMVDGFKIIEDTKKREPEFFEILSSYQFPFLNRSKTSDYRWQSPMFVYKNGQIDEIRFGSFLRGPMCFDADKMSKAYAALRYLYQIVQDTDYQINFKYDPGDCICFDNRRILHARKAYETGAGERHLQGIYQEREELYSRLRVLKRNKLAKENQMPDA